MSAHLDYAQISRQARIIVDAKRVQTVTEQAGQLDGPSSEGQRKRLRYTRSTKGCLGCRKQKVKCDEIRPACLRCVAAQRACQYPPPKSSAAASTSSRARYQSKKAERQGRDRGSLGWEASELDDDAGSNVNGYVTGNGETTSEDCGAQARAHGMRAMYPAGAESMKARGGLNPEAAAINLNDVNDYASSAYDNARSSESDAVSNSVQSSSVGANVPQLASISKSALLHRRAGKKSSISVAPEPLDIANAAVRLFLVDSMIHAFANDGMLFEFSPSKRVSDLASGTLGTVDLLSNAFASPTARTLFNQYCNVTSRYLITMGNIGPNPLLGLCTPPNLLDTTASPSAAIRMSILSISSAHYAFETAEAIGSLANTPEWAVQKESLRAMSEKFKKAALSNITLTAANSDSSVHQVDCILAACTFLCIRDVICADPTWQENLEFALSVIAKRGGPQAMLKGAEYSFIRRYLLENLATHDVFSKEPTLLGNYDTWWFDSVETSTTRWEWESVERSFGVSRAMVDLVARVAKLDSQKRRLGLKMVSPSPEMWDVSQHFVRESECLLVELDIWGNSLAMLPQHSRVTCGDYVYKYMLTIFLCADILEQPISTARIAKAVDYVLELCSEAAAMRMSVMLVWPLLIAGVFCLPQVREKVSSLLDAIGSDYCEDLVAARELLEEQWRCIDRDLGKQPWSDVMRRLSRYVLLI